jgi:PAS domain S-box-containing protein
MPRKILSAKTRVTELRESEMRFRGLSALSADVYWEQDEQLRFRSFSNAGSREFELGRTESLLGKTRWETDYINMTEADWAAHRALLVARRPFRDLELCRCNAAGRKFWVRVSGEPVFDASGAFRGYRGIARNFTGRRRAEELRELEHTVTRILAEADSASAGLQAVFRAVCETEGWECGRYFRLDEQAGVLRFADGWSVPDAAVERFVELSRDHVYHPGQGLSGLAWQTGQPLWCADVTKDPRTGSGSSKIPPHGIGMHGAFVFPVVLDGKTVGVFNFATRKAREPEEQLVEAITSIGRQIGQFLQRRQADEQRRILEAKLRQAQKMEAIGTLATGMAHEFNNVLRAILANVELARMDIASAHPVRANIEEIDKAGRRARDFVQRILAFARPQAPQRRRLTPCEVVQEAVRLMRATVPPQIQLVVEIGPDTPAVLADATQIHQLLINLCTNACQAMEGRSGKIVVSLSGTTLSAAAMHGTPGLQPGRFAHMSVSDSGIGIDPAIRERIFDPFFSTKPAGEGTGLGLAVVNGIVQAHEGAIEVESQPGKGATFHVYLPAAQETQEHVAAEEPPVHAHSRSRRVLFLDDNEELVSALVKTLSRQGYRVNGHTAPNAALDAVRAEPQAYDVFVSDHKMPGMSGLDVARELSRIRPDLPVIIISGYVDNDLQRTARELGVRRLLHKLHTLDELVEVIDQLTGD